MSQIKLLLHLALFSLFASTVLSATQTQANREYSKFFGSIVFIILDPFSSTYQFWSPITNLIPNSKVFPVYVRGVEDQIDLVVGAPNQKIEWFLSHFILLIVKV